MNARSERGSVFVETALVALVVMTLFLGLAQFALWFHAQHVVLGAAQDGAHEAALEGAAADAGGNRARELMKAGLGSMAPEAGVSVRVTERLAIVTVEAAMPSIVPFLPTMKLRAEGRAFRERFLADGERP
ncbi:MAG: pilus assembly protein [Actinomycetota bacterium]|nr:pilus assembly protein [Actinomycetota bacterium]